jgi:hypothetical protein
MGASLAAVLVVLAVVPWRFALFATGHFLGSCFPLLPRCRGSCAFGRLLLPLLAVVSFVLASVLLYPLEGNRLMILTSKCLWLSFEKYVRPPPPNKCRDQFSSPHLFLIPNRVFLLGPAGRLAVLLLLPRLLGSPWGGSFGVLWLVGFGGVVGSAMAPEGCAGGPHWIPCARAGLVLGFCGFKGAAATLPTCAPPTRQPESVP